MRARTGEFSDQQRSQSGKGAGTRAVVGDRFRQSAGGPAPGGGQRKCDRGRPADFLSAEGSEFAWVSRSSNVLDEVDRENRKLLDKRHADDQWAATATILIAVISSLLAVALGMIIAYRTATGITEPLNRLIHVADRSDRPGSRTQHRRARPR
jgi:hypothetical protein